MKITIVAFDFGVGYKSGDRLTVIDIDISKIDATKFTEWRTLIKTEVLRRFGIILTDANIALLKFRSIDDISLPAVSITNDAQTIAPQPATAFINFRITDPTNIIEDALAKAIRRETSKTATTQPVTSGTEVAAPPKLGVVDSPGAFIEAMKAANFSLDFIRAQAQMGHAREPAGVVPVLPLLTKTSPMLTVQFNEMLAKKDHASASVTDATLTSVQPVAPPVPVVAPVPPSVPIPTGKGVVNPVPPVLAAPQNPSLANPASFAGAKQVDAPVIPPFRFIRTGDIVVASRSAFVKSFGKRK
jgi:hypothetical protein